MTIIMTNLDAGVLPASIGLSSELVTSTAVPTNVNNINLIGDVSGVGTSTIHTAITPGAVTYAKLQNESAATLLGNPGGSAAAPSEILPGGGLVLTGITLATPGGLLNKFRNGTMDVWQRGTASITVTTAGAYVADGWIVTPTGASCTAIQATNNRSGANTLFGLQLTGAASVTDITLSHRIESYIAAALGGKTVTVQAWVFNNTAASITPTLKTQIAGTTDVWTSPTTDLAATNLQVCANSVWTQVSYTFAVSTNAKLGYAFIFDFGNNFSSTGKNVIVAELDVRSTPSATIGINSAPPPPELRPVFVELPFCQRYFAKTFPQGTVAANGTGDYGCIATNSGNYSTALALEMMWTLPQTMRAAPTVVVYNPSAAGTPGASGDFFGGSISAGIAIVSSDDRIIFNMVTGSGTAYTPCAHATASAEL